MIHLEKCPVCASAEIHSFIDANDFSLTNEKFPLKECTNCKVIFTNDIPDEENIGKYYKFSSYVSHTDTKETLFFKIYHLVRNFMMQVKYNWIKRFPFNSKNVLDIGSGSGAFLSFMKNKGWKIYGIEADEGARANAASFHQIESYPPEELFKLKDKTFDVISLWHVLEHIHDLHGYLGKIKELLDHDGILVIAVPNPTSLDAKHYMHHWAAYDVPRHLYHFTPEAMEFIASMYEFKIVSMKRMWFDAFYASILSEKYKNGFKLKGILVGLISNLYALFDRRKTSSITYILKHY